MQSQRILNVITISKQFNVRPSSVIGLENTYEAFCFDEACMYITEELNKENHQEPNFLDRGKRNRNRNRNNSDVIDWLRTNNSN